MRFAYADPPYPGQAKRWYGNHPDYAGEVDHGELIERLCRDYPDGWALSTSQAALQQVLALCPADVRIAVWHNTCAEPPGGKTDNWHLVWEPVIVRGGRRGGLVVRNLLACGALTGGLARASGHVIPGQKPPAFIRWILDLLGFDDGDDIDDIFPGSGACDRIFKARAQQITLPMRPERRPERINRQLAASGNPGFPWPPES